MKRVIILMLLFFVSMSHARKPKTEPNAADTGATSIATVVREMEAIKAAMDRQENFIHQHREEMDSQNKKIDEQAKKIEAQSRIIQQLKEDTVNEKSHKTLIAGLQQNEEKEVDFSLDTDMRDAKTTYACLHNNMQLSCDSGSLVEVVFAEYGYYDKSCGSNCCRPNLIRDCVESVEVEDAPTWTSLKVACDDKTSCRFQYQGAVATSCSEDQVADYMAVIYLCKFMPGLVSPNNETAGFTAYSYGLDVYERDDVIIFAYSVSNVAGQYDVSEGVFTCPYDGLYLFTLIIMCVDERQVNAGIFMNGDLLVGAFADNFNTVNAEIYSQASNTVVVECSVGDRVWVQAIRRTEVHSDDQRRSTFTGALLHRYNY